jgi:acyl carrier protein
MLGNWFGEDDMARDLDAMRAWLIERISKALKVKGRMDPDAPLSKYGLQSIDAVILAMEIEEEVGGRTAADLVVGIQYRERMRRLSHDTGPAIAA